MGAGEEIVALLIYGIAFACGVWFLLQMAEGRDMARKAGPGAGRETPRPGDGAHDMSLTHVGTGL